MKYVLLTNGIASFYSDDLYETLPQGAIPITDNDWMTYLNDQQSYTFDSTGRLISISTDQLLANAKRVKSAQLQDSYTQDITAGFSSSATGTSYQFNYGTLDQMKFLKLAIDVAQGNAIYPIPIPAKGGIIVNHDQTQYQQLSKDISAFEWNLQNKLHTLLSQVQGATTVDAVNAIAWS